MQNESSKTMMYVAVAAVMAAAGLFLSPGGAKSTPDGLDSLIGAEFYKGFTQPSDATSIEVIGYDPATATVMPFSVEFKDGLWRIPTRYNYPADAKDRLSKVAASIIGIRREALAGRSESEQAEFQVLDPKAEKTENLKGIGNRVTLRNGNTVLADYIIGKQVPSRSGFYYVRKPDEKATFIAKVELNLSTKFTDWIENDVLNLDGPKLTNIGIHKYSLEFAGNRVSQVGEEVSSLTRKNSSDPWTLAGLEEAKEELNQDEVRKLVTALDDLKIVGVKPKPAELREMARTGEITTPPGRETEMEMFDRGFVFLQSQRGIDMYCKEGRMVAGTEQGIEYDMRFGDVFEGSDEEVELGFAKPQADESQKDESQKDNAEKKDADKKGDGAAGSKKKSRFIIVTARVNPELFGPLEEPVKPEEPQAEPEAATKSDAEEDKSGDKKSSEKSDEKPELKETQKQPGETKEAEEKPAEGEKEPPEPPKEDPKKAYAAALKKYEADRQKYEGDLQAREEKVKEAEEKVKGLNARFADWYYVISAESFENLRQGRATLVKAKPEPEKPESKPEGEGEGDAKDDAANKPEEKKNEKPTAKPEKK